MEEMQGRVAVRERRIETVRTASAVLAVVGILAVLVAAAVAGGLAWQRSATAWRPVDAPLGTWTMDLPDRPEWDRQSAPSPDGVATLQVATGGVAAGDDVRITLRQTQVVSPQPVAGTAADVGRPEFLRVAAEGVWEGTSARVGSSAPVAGSAGTGHLVRASLSGGAAGRSYAVSTGPTDVLVLVVRAPTARDADATLSRLLGSVRAG